MAHSTTKHHFEKATNTLSVLKTLRKEAHRNASTGAGIRNLGIPRKTCFTHR